MRRRAPAASICARQAVVDRLAGCPTGWPGSPPPARARPRRSRRLRPRASSQRALACVAAARLGIGRRVEADVVVAAGHVERHEAHARRVPTRDSRGTRAQPQLGHRRLRGTVLRSGGDARARRASRASAKNTSRRRARRSSGSHARPCARGGSRSTRCRRACRRTAARSVELGAARARRARRCRLAAALDVADVRRRRRAGSALMRVDHVARHAVSCARGRACRPSRRRRTPRAKARGPRRAARQSRSAQRSSAPRA